MRILSSPSRRRAAHAVPLRLLLPAAALLATCLLPSSTAIGIKPGGSPLPFAIMLEGTGVGVSEEVAGVKATADAYVDPNRPTSSTAGVCLGFDAGSQRLVPDVDTNGGVVVYVGFIGSTSLNELLPGGAAESDAAGGPPEPAEDGFPIWVYVEGTPLPRSAPQELGLPGLPAPPGTTWGTYEAGYSQSDC